MNYKEKYIKYKLKYLGLLRNKLSGGASRAELDNIETFERDELKKHTCGIKIGENRFYIQDYFITDILFLNVTSDKRTHIDMCCVTVGDPLKLNYFSCYSSKSDAGSWRLSMTSSRDKMEYYKGPNYVTGNLIHPKLQEYIQISINTYIPRVQNVTWGNTRTHNGLYIVERYNDTTQQYDNIYGGKWFFSRTKPIEFFDKYYEKFESDYKHNPKYSNTNIDLMAELNSPIENQIKYNYLDKYNQLMDSEYNSPMTYYDKFKDMNLPNVAELFNKINLFSNSAETICGNAIGVRPGFSKISGREFKDNMLHYINNNYKLTVDQPIIAELIRRFTEFRFENPTDFVEHACIQMVEQHNDTGTNKLINIPGVSRVTLKLLNECDEISNLILNFNFLDGEYRDKEQTIDNIMNIAYLKHFIPTFGLPPINELPTPNPPVSTIFGIHVPVRSDLPTFGINSPARSDLPTFGGNFSANKLPSKSTQTGGSSRIDNTTPRQIYDHKMAYKNRIPDFYKKWQTLADEFRKVGDYMIIILNKLHMETMRFIYATIQKEINNVTHTDFTASRLVYSKSFELDDVKFDVNLYVSPVIERNTNKLIMNFYHYALRRHDDTRKNWATMPHYYEIIGETPTINGISKYYYEGGLYLCKPFEYIKQSRITCGNGGLYEFARTELAVNETYVYLGDLYSDLTTDMPKPREDSL